MKVLLTILFLSLCSSVVAQDSVDVSVQRQKRIMFNVAFNLGHSNMGLFGDVDTIGGLQVNAFSSVSREEVRGVQLSSVFFLRTPHYESESLPNDIIQYRHWNEIPDQRSMVCLSVSYNIFSGKQKNVEKKINNKDWDKGTL